jgi:hypothetical protein
MKQARTWSHRDKGDQMREIRIEKARWDFGLACGSLSLVMLLLIGERHKPLVSACGLIDE